MSRQILADTCVSISELKKNPSFVVSQGEGFPVAVLNRNEPDFYCIPATAWEEIVDRLEDVELNAIADARQDQAIIEVDVNDL
ncbi:type II toxin-antitoxin system Phd/YefM family antitoxin [Aestuariirhabdus sp. LZHN29]|uniref:type II toxin-antitoxin system Phd/YefM family antitoxin n=1 Tax=Aestuariirhabdus sp. LZHN29 TaxID=3417462 RepID=UPI003CE6804C